MAQCPQGRRWVVLLSVLALTLPCSFSQDLRSLETWWTMANQVRLPAGTLGPVFPGCDQLKLLTENQRAACNQGSEIGIARMTVLARASLASTMECEKQFTGQRWNCETFLEGPLFGRHILYNGTREAAFVHALMAASVAHESAKACSEGRLLGDCNCVTNYHEDTDLKAIVDSEQEGFYLTRSEYRWKNCDNNILYGLRMAKKFQSVEPRDGIWSEERKLMNLHNEKLGRSLIKAGFHRAPVCTCLGFTGSCATRVCWREVPNFRQVGNTLFRLYSRAQRVQISDDASELVKAQQDISVPTVAGATATPAIADPPSEFELVQGADTLSFCDANPSLDIAGTPGRTCQESGSESDGCGPLCCFRGYRAATVTQHSPCGCRFVWCCNVKCDTCTNSYKRNTCS